MRSPHPPAPCAGAAATPMASAASCSVSATPGSMMTTVAGGALATGGLCSVKAGGGERAAHGLHGRCMAPHACGLRGLGLVCAVTPCTKLTVRAAHYTRRRRPRPRRRAPPRERAAAAAL